MRVSERRWALLGPGAIGLNYGAHLAESGVSLSIVARSDREALASHGIRLRVVSPATGVPERERAVTPAAVVGSAGEAGTVDAVIIAAKSTANEDLIGDLRALVVPGRTILLTLQNGMGNAEFFARHFPENPVLGGLCFICVNRVAPGVVENYHPGRVEIGSFDDRWPGLAESAAAMFEAAGVRARYAPELDAALWRKLCWNVPFNGLSIAAGGVTTDLILADPAIKNRARRLMNEVRAAAAAAGHGIPDKFIEGQFEVTEKMGAYRPSSLIDHLEGRPVEIEPIWGEPLRRGRALGVAMPELEKLYGEIRGRF